MGSPIRQIPATLDKGCSSVECWKLSMGHRESRISVPRPIKLTENTVHKYRVIAILFV